MSIIERILKRFFYKLYAVLHLRATLKNYRFFKNSIFIVYSHGKTGSSTIYYTLLKYLPFNHVHHVHYLSDEWIEGRIPNGKKSKNTRNIILTQKAYKAIYKKNWKKIYYITCARDPFTRGMSAYFHNEKQSAIRGKSVEGLRKEIQNYAVDISLNWFQTDYCQYTGIPFEEINFDNQKGYCIVKKNVTDYLIIRTDKISARFQESFKILTGFYLPDLEHVNKRSSTRVADIYNEMKDYYFEDRAILERKINSEFIAKFFSDKEKKVFYEKYKETS